MPSLVWKDARAVQMDLGDAASDLNAELGAFANLYLVDDVVHVYGGGCLS